MQFTHQAMIIFVFCVFHADKSMNIKINKSIVQCIKGQTLWRERELIFSTACFGYNQTTVCRLDLLKCEDTLYHFAGHVGSLQDHPLCPTDFMMHDDDVQNFLEVLPS